MASGGGKAGTAGELAYSPLLSRVTGGRVKSGDCRAPAVVVTDQSSKAFTAVTPTDQQDLTKRLEAQGANISFKAAGGLTVVGFLLQSLPVLLLIGVWIFFMRQMQGGARGAMGF